MQSSNKLTQYDTVDMLVLSLLHLPSQSTEYQAINAMHAPYYDSMQSQLNYLINANDGNTSDYDMLNEMLLNADYINHDTLSNIFNHSVLKILKQSI